MRKNQKEKAGKIARERIDILFEEAKKTKDRKLSDRYAELARKISMKTKTKMPREFKRRICKNCRKFLVPGENCRVRVAKGRIIYYCFNCKKYMRFPLR
ncbi:ribonuclease P [Candidatus Woesearchaeota archaeon]|nr:ribonuclease P [Candidatus Woesearchaeota archaeon]